MINCRECKNSIFCESWGEWKCAKFHFRIRNIVMEDCEGYVFSDRLKKDCQCNTCQKYLQKDEDNE